MAAYNPALDTNPQGYPSARDAVAVTPSDTVDFTTYARALFIGVTGNVSVIPLAQAGTGTAVVFKGVAAGTVLNLACRRVNSTATTATDIVALY